MMDALDVCRILRDQCRSAGGQRAWAQANGVSEQYVCDILNARREPGDKILAAIGLRRVVRYVEMRSAQTEERAASHAAALNTQR